MAQDQPPPIQPDKEQTNSKAAREERKEQQTSTTSEPQKPMTQAEMLGILVSVALLIVVLFQAYIYNKQWKAMLKQSELMSRTIEESIKTRQMENRPWVNAESAELVKPIEMPPSARFAIILNITVRNSGTSVATDGMAYIHVVSNVGAMQASDWNKPCETIETQRAAIKASEQYVPYPVGFVLAPSQAVKLEIGTASDEITEEQARGGQFYILVCTTYRDQYALWHRTRSCFRPTSTIVDPANVVFKVCNVFQSAD